MNCIPGSFSRLCFGRFFLPVLAGMFSNHGFFLLNNPDDEATYPAARRVVSVHSRPGLAQRQPPPRAGSPRWSYFWLLQMWARSLYGAVHNMPQAQSGPHYCDEASFLARTAPLSRVERVAYLPL